MNKPEIDIVYDCITEFGDEFWNEEPDEDMVSNKYLFNDILTYVNKAGYDFQLIIDPTNKKQSV